MNFSNVLSQYLASFGISVSQLVHFAKFAPIIVVAGAFFGFMYSNMRKHEDETREKIAKKLLKAGRSTNRGLTSAELAARIAPNLEEKGLKKVLLDVAEILLKLAKFDRKATEEKLIQAGDRDPRAISRYILQRGAGMAIAPAIGYMIFPALGIGGVLQLVASAVCVLAGGIIVDVRLDKALKKRRDQLATELPVVLDLMTIYLEAGQSFDVALARASGAMRVSFPTISDEIGFLRHELELAVDREKTLRDFAKRLNSPTASTFISIVIQAERRGNAVAPSLRTLAKESRKDVIAAVEKKAQKLPTLIQGPMFIFILPAIFLSVIGPAVIQVMAQFGGG